MEPQNNAPSTPDFEKTSLGKKKFFSHIFEKTVNRDLFWIIAVFSITAAAFLPALTFKELVSDDHFYFLNVLAVDSSLLHIFDPVLGLRTPLTSLSLYTDYLVWGEKNFLFGAHLVNILLHCGNGILFFLLLRTLKWGEKHLTPAWAGIAALAFALHPQRVESVAWLCERKDCLAMFLGLGALLCFLRAMRRNRISWAAGILLLLSFLAKPMWLFFFVPAAALVWSERRSFEWKFYLKVLIIPIMLFLIFTVPQLVSIFSAPANPGMSVPLLFKLETILHNYGNYFIRTFIPGNLFPLYPYYNPALDPRWMALIPIALCFVPFLAREKEFRSAIIYGIVPLLVCFAALLLPVAGFHRIGNTDFADRYSYLPSLFLIIGAAFLLKLNIPRESAFARWLPILGVLYCGGLFYKTETYLPVWKSSLTYNEHACTPLVPNFNAAFNMAVHHYNKSEFAKARKICQEKLPEVPHYPEDFNNIIKIFKLAMEGLIRFREGKADMGIRYLNTIYMSSFSGMVRNFPLNFAREVFVRGAEYHLKKYNNRQGAANLYNRCAVLFKLHSEFYAAFYGGMAAVTLEDYAEAVRHFKRACTLNPREKSCRQNLNYAIKMLEAQKK